MFGNFLIGLREGLEASLVVSLLIAYLVRTNNKKALRPLWVGVAMAISLSIGLAAMLTFTSTSLLQSFESREIFGGVMSLIAVGFVTWMIFWMKKMGINLRCELETKMQDALVGGALTIAACAFISVSREGVETSLFFWSSLQSTRDSIGSNSYTPLWGFLIGIVTAVVLAIALYKQLLKINLGKFFTNTGMLLIFVAGGILAYAFHDLQEGGLIPGINSVAFDATSVLDPNSIHGALFRGIIPISPQPTWLEISVFIIYIGVVLSLYIAQPKMKTILKRSAPVAPIAAMVIVLALTLTGCSSKESSSSKLIVTSDSKSCTFDDSKTTAGDVEMSVYNKDSKVTEVYILKDGIGIAELENVGPSQTRKRMVDLEPGDYTILCKPGMKGKGIGADITVKK